MLVTFSSENSALQSFVMLMMNGFSFLFSKRNVKLMQLFEHFLEMSFGVKFCLSLTSHGGCFAPKHLASIFLSAGGGGYSSWKDEQLLPHV